jgi:hypothetical protein
MLWECLDSSGSGRLTMDYELRLPATCGRTSCFSDQLLEAECGRSIVSTMSSIRARYCRLSTAERLLRDDSSRPTMALQ